MPHRTAGTAIERGDFETARAYDFGNLGVAASRVMRPEKRTHGDESFARKDFASAMKHASRTIGKLQTPGTPRTRGGWLDHRAFKGASARLITSVDLVTAWPCLASASTSSWSRLLPSSLE